MDRNETLVPLDLSDAIAMTQRQKQEIAELRAIVNEVNAEKDAEIADLKVELQVSKALEARFFPQEAAHDVVNKLTVAGFGGKEYTHGNTLLGMAENCLDSHAALKTIASKIEMCLGLRIEALNKEIDALKAQIQMIFEKLVVVVEAMREAQSRK